MRNFIYELGQSYLEETLSREFVFPDGETVQIEMWRIHWVLYDRYADRYPDRFEKTIMNGLQHDADWNPRRYGDCLAKKLVKDAERVSKEGKDPLETNAARLLRQSRMWKLRQSRRRDAADKSAWA